MPKIRQIAARIIKPIAKQSTTNQAQSNVSAAGDDFIAHHTDLRGLKTLVSNSTILPQCIRAYKNNIAGFGIAVRYKNDEPETPEMKKEWEKISEVLEFLNMDQNTKELFEDIIEAREIYGISYLEVIRNLAGEVNGIEFIRQTPTIQKTAPLDPFIEVEYFVKGRTEKRPKRFCKYRQQHNGKTVYFKEIGDPRIMDKRNGDYGEGIPLKYHANEIIEFAVGTEVYGEVRWIGQVLGADGSRRAEGLNNRYFSEGRHTPMMIMVKGGTLTDDSFTKLQEYVNGIKGESGQHAFIVLEAANMDNRTDIEGEQKPEIQIVNMASMLQRDELFQAYQDNHRRKVQSAFQLPDLYVGYTTDFNRATALAAQEVTEQQVFQPERTSLSWAINNKLLSGYNFQYVEAYFLAPEVTNTDDMVKLLNVAVRAGGVTPNKAKEIAYKAMGGVSEDYEGDWGEIPLEVRKLSLGAKEIMGLVPEELGLPSEEKIDELLSRQIQKATERKDAEIAAVLKEIRNLLREGEVINA
jgi:PBSX family phage portal protein